MDFIVLGGILGAVMMVAGTVLRDLVPRRLRVPGDDTPWVSVRDRRRTVRSALAGGRLLTIAGVVVLLATVVMVFFETPDTAAFAIVVGLTVIGLIASVGWVLWYRYQESSGAIQRRQLQLIASRLGSVRSDAGNRNRLPDREDRAVDRSRTGQSVEAEQRPARRDDSGPPNRRPANNGPEPPRKQQRGVDSSDDRRGLPTRNERSPGRREMQHIDHHPVAPRNDRPVPRPPNRDPLRQPTEQSEGAERVRRDSVVRSRSPESRPAAPSARTRPER